MELIRYQDVQVFQDATLEFLLEKEAENNLILGLTNGLLNGEHQDSPPYLIAIEDAGEIILVALHTPPRALILSTIRTGFDVETVYQLLIDDFLAEFGSIKQVNGLINVAAPFITQVQSQTGAVYEVSMAMRIYKLKQIIPVTNVPGKLRYAESSDLDLLVRWMVGFNQDSWGIASDEARLRTRLADGLTQDKSVRGLLLWEDDGKPTSLVGYSGPTPNGMRVAPVYTPPELRGNGYASAATAALSQKLLDEGRKFCFLYTDLTNPTSNKIYINVGYEPVCDVNEYQRVTR